jgi:site-specific DNA recombinase
MHSHTNTARHERKRLAIVGRVSTEDQEEYGTSLDDQLAKGRLLAQLHDFTVYTQDGRDDIYSGDESGTLPRIHRPIMRRLIADAKAHRFDAGCFTKINRSARRLKYILEIWDALDEAGVTVRVIDPALDTATPIGRLIRNVLGSIAEFERDTIVERTAAGRRRKIANGDSSHTGTPYGYTYVRGDRAAGTCGHNVKDECKADVVRRCFEWRARGHSWERIAVRLTAEGAPTPTGAHTWHWRSVQNIVQNRRYTGHGYWGEREAGALSQRQARLAQAQRRTCPHPHHLSAHRQRRVIPGGQPRGHH